MNELTKLFSGGEVYALPVGELRLLFSPLTWSVAVVNRAAVTELARLRAEPPSAPAGEVPRCRSLLELAGTPGHRWRGDSSKLVIMPTRACNMRCVYCDFEAEHALARELDPRLACRVIEDYADRLQAENENMLRIHFFGGEALTALTCTETIVHYVRALCARRGLVPWFELTTNGFFAPGLLPFIGDYMDVVVVSLDGPASFHDGNRQQRNGRGTYETVASNVRQLAAYPVELCLRTCITDLSVSSMKEITEFFCSEFAFDVLSFEMLAENDCARVAGLHAPDPYRFAAGFLESERAGTRHGIQVVHGPSELTGPRISSCPLGQNTVMLSPDGRLSACYLNPEQWSVRGLDLEIGRIDAMTGVTYFAGQREQIASLLLDKPRCERCFCRFTCAGGCHVNQTPPGCSLAYDERCTAIRLITACRFLRRAGCDDQADHLIRQTSAMEALATHPDDRIDRIMEEPPL